MMLTFRQVRQVLFEPESCVVVQYGGLASAGTDNLINKAD